MKTILISIIAVGTSLAAVGETRTWTSSNGQTTDGEYVSLVGGNVLIRKADNNTIKVPLEGLSEEDQLFVELENAPTVKVEYREDAQPRQYVADPWIPNGGGLVDNHAIFVTEAKFGAEIIQTSMGDYDHELVAEMYIFTKQNYDISKYHIVARFKSEPFKLTKENKKRFSFESDRVYKLLKYNLYSQRKRGEILGEYLILIRDQRGEIIGYNSSKKWLYNNLAKLEELPVGAWMNNKCERVHPTSPEWTQ